MSNSHLLAIEAAISALTPEEAAQLMQILKKIIDSERNEPLTLREERARGYLEAIAEP